MQPESEQEFAPDVPDTSYSLGKLQKTALSLMAVLVLITFVGANLHAVLWQSSDWLVSTVLPATVVDLTNQERSQLQQTPLQRNATLDAAAELKAQHMAQNEYFSHYSPTGVSPWHWFDEAGYTYAHAGENLAIHFTDSSQVVDAWMQSPTHRENIVNGQYTEIGVGTAKGSYEGYDTVYVVQLFGSPGVAPAAASAPAQQPSTVATAPEPSAPQVAAAQSDTAAKRPVEPSLPAAEPSELETQPQADPTTSKTTTQPDESPQSASAEETPAVEEPTADPVVPVTASEPTDSASAPGPTQTDPDQVPDAASEPVSQPADSAVVQNPTTSELDPAQLPNETSNQEVVVIESPIISTSSGLAVASITIDNPAHAGATSVASVATKPNTILQYIYLTLGIVVVFLLSASVILEARRLRVIQVAYSMLLLLGMGGLWFLNGLLTSGAVIT